MSKKIKSKADSEEENKVVNSNMNVYVGGEKDNKKNNKSTTKYDKIFDIDSESDTSSDENTIVVPIIPIVQVVPIVSIPKETISRLLKDIKDMVSSSLEEEYGIYYKHSDTNILKAYVLIVGPEDSLYFGGYYFFTIDFPLTYPYEPPLITFLTSDSNTRFHPNFHKSGKVCLSIINTWRGEQWTSCLTIKSILITIVSIMDNKPMLHEPGVTQTYADFNNYHNMIAYKNIDFACLRLLQDFNKTNIVFNDRENKENKENKEYFYKIMVETFTKNAKKMHQVIKTWKSKKINNFYNIKVLYNMSCHVNFDELEEEFLEYTRVNNISLIE